MPRVLLVGWREPSARALAHQGAEVVCLHSMQHAAAVAESEWVSDSTAVDDVTSAEEVLYAASQLAIDYGRFDAICSGSEFPLVAAAVAHDVLGGFGLPTSVALRLRDKYTQKAAVRAAGLLVADTRIHTNESPPSNSAGPPARFPAVVKPLAGGGAASTFVVATDEDLVARTAGRSRWLVESYVEGLELQIDGVVRGGELTLLTVSRYLDNLITIHDGQLAGAVVIPPSEDPDLYRRATDLCERALASLGHTEGVFHLEAFDTETGLVFSECAGRVSGGSADEAIRLSTGQDIHDEWAKSVLERPTDARMSWSSRAFGDVQLPAPSGVIERIPSVELLTQRSGVESARVHLEVGETMGDATQASDVRAATVVLGGESSAHVRASIYELAEWFAANVVTRST